MNKLTDAELDRVVADALKKFLAFNARETEACLSCGQHVTRLEKIGRCVYAFPCGCRLWQGNVPKVWRT